MYEAARFMREYTEKNGWEYPENYVFSQLGTQPSVQLVRERRVSELWVRVFES